MEEIEVGGNGLKFKLNLFCEVNLFVFLVFKLLIEVKSFFMLLVNLVGFLKFIELF